MSVISATQSQAQSLTLTLSPFVLVVFLLLLLSFSFLLLPLHLPSSSQLRKEKSKLLTSLQRERATVSRLVRLLDDEVDELESPLGAVQDENLALRSTLDSFFQRNILLTKSFLHAKKTYELLFTHYHKLKDKFATYLTSGGKLPLPPHAPHASNLL